MTLKRFKKSHLWDILEKRQFPCVLAVTSIALNDRQVLIIEVHPLFGFTHFFKTKKCISSMFKMFGCYRIEVCSTHDIDSMRQEYGQIVVDNHINHLYERFDGMEVELELEFPFCARGILVGMMVGDLSEDPSLKFLYEFSRPLGSPICISM